MKRTTKRTTGPATKSPAPRLEVAQLATGTEVLSLARTVLDDPTSPYTAVRYAGLRLAECLADALHVAASRGMRVPAPDTEDGRQAAQETGSGLWS